MIKISYVPPLMAPNSTYNRFTLTTRSKAQPESPRETAKHYIRKVAQQIRADSPDDQVPLGRLPT